MNRTRFLCILGLALVFGTTQVQAYDFGGAVKSTSLGEVDVDALTFTFNQTEQLDLWLSLNFLNSASLFVKGFGSITIPADGSDITWNANLEAFNFTAAVSQAFGAQTNETIKVGRFVRYDSQAIAFNHILDGIRSESSFPGLNLNLDVATSMLLFKKSSTIVLSHADNADVQNDAIALGSPRLFLNLDLEMPRLFVNQTLALSVWSQIDLRANLLAAGQSLTSSNTNGGGWNTIISSLTLKGALASPLYYSLFGYFEAGVLTVTDGSYLAGDTLRDVTLLAGLGGMDIKLYLKEALNSTITLASTIGTGDADASTGYPESDTSGTYTSFMPLSTYAPHLLFNPGLSNLWETNLSYSIKPADALQFQLGGSLFVRPLPGPVGNNSVALISGNASPYLGTEVDFTTNLRLTAELGILLQAGAFFPNIEAVNQNNSLYLKGQVNLSF